MQLTFLGTCGNQTADREATNLLFTADDVRLVIDAGPGVVRQLYRVGVSPAEVTDILITHAHGDHSSGFAYLIWSSFYERLLGADGPNVIRVRGSASTLEGLQAMLSFHYDPAAFPFEIEWIALPLASTESRIGAFDVTTVPVLHSVPNLGLVVSERRGSAVAYSSDTVYCDDFVAAAQSASLMVHEGFCGEARRDLAARTRHATVEEAGRAAAKAGVGELMLVHIFPPEIGNESSLIAEARRHFGGDVSFPPDLITVDR